MPSMPGVLLQLGADRVARAGHEVHDPVRDAGIAQGLDELPAHERGVGGRLHDHRVARDQGPRGRTTGQGHREVEGADDRPHAVGLEDGPGVLLRRQGAHGLDEAVMGLHLVGVVAQQVGRLLHVAEGLEPVLADLEGHERGVRELSLADEVRGAADDLEPLPPAEVAPAREGRACGLYGVANVLAGADRETADDDVRVDRRPMFERLGRGPQLGADEHRIRPAKLGASGFHRGVEGLLQLGVVGAEGGVGDLQSGRGGRHESALLEGCGWRPIIASAHARSGHSGRPGSGGRRTWPPSPR